MKGTPFMAFDFKKTQKNFYLPKNKPEIITVPTMNYLAVWGQGDPNETDGAYSRAIAMLYAVAYTLKMSYKTAYKIHGFFEYVVPPLEGFWWQEGIYGANHSSKADFRWISVIRLPDFVSPADVEWAKQEATQKKKTDCSAVEFFALDEGLCVQMMHIGPYDDEPATIETMDAYLRKNGYCNDFSQMRLHHEIYLSDPRKTTPEKQRTVIRHPIRKKEPLHDCQLL